MLLNCGSLSSWVRRFVACVGGCFGCAQPTPIIAVDEPSKGLRIQGRSVKRRHLSDDFWSSSPHEMENSALQSRHSMSSISTAAQPNDQHAAGSSSNPNEFVNQGLLQWHQTRQQWIGKRKRNSQGQQSREPKIRLVVQVSFFFLLWNTKGLSLHFCSGQNSSLCCNFSYMK
uniref:Gag1-like clamp domain-containing protein n=1 Tax=Setaria italica TaxID=4555 RepID=K3YW60_SETIT